MTFHTLLGPSRKNIISSCLVGWPHANNKLSIATVKRIVSPSLDDLATDTLCKVKGLEKHLCKMLSVGTEEEMETKTQEMEIDPITRQRPKKGKENKIQHSAARGRNKRKGNVILVGAVMSANNPPPPSDDKKIIHHQGRRQEFRKGRAEE